MTEINKITPDYYNKYSRTVGNITINPLFFLYSQSFCVSNIFKYLLRYRDKGGIEDLKKALTYLDYYEYYTSHPNLSTNEKLQPAYNDMMDSMRKDNPLFNTFYNDFVFRDLRGIQDFSPTRRAIQLAIDELSEESTKKE